MVLTEFLKNYFKELAKGQEQVQFEDWVQFMASRETTDKLDLNQLKDSFQNLTNGHPTITEDQLRVAGVDQGTIDFVANNFERSENGYDFGGYLNKTFN